MTFRPSNATPRFLPPPDPSALIAHPSQDIGGGLESLFSNYLAAKQNQRAQTLADNQNALAGQQLAAGNRAAAGQNLQETVQFGAPLTSFTPEQIQAASTPATSQDQQMAQDQEPPMMAHLRQGIETIRQQRAAQLAQAGAELGKTQSETRGANAKAALDEIQSNLLGGPGAGASAGGAGQAPPIPSGQEGNIVQNVLDAVKNKQMAPSQADDWLGRNPLVHLAYVNAASKSGLDLRGLENEYQKNKATASYEGGATVQTPVRLIQSVGPILASIQDSAKANNFGSFTPANKAKLMLGRVFGTPESLTHQGTVIEARKQLGSILAGGGAPSEADKADANSLLPDDASPEQYAQALQVTLPKLLEARGRAISGAPVNIPGIGANAPKTTNADTAAAQASPASMTPITRTLKNGQTVRVIPLGGGRFQAVP